MIIVGSNRNIIEQHENSEHAFDQSTTVPTSNTSHHIPIAEPNFPRVAVPFAIGMWVLGVCIIKTGRCRYKTSTFLIENIYSLYLFVPSLLSLFHSGERLAEIIGLVP